MKRNTTSQSVSIGLLIIRLSIGVLMLFHGIAKLNGVPFIEGMMEARGLPAFFAYGVYIGEILAPILLIIGYRTRIAALIFLVNCLVAMFMAHSEDVFTMSDHGGWTLELLGLYMFVALALIFTGGGKFAVSTRKRWD